MTYVNVKVWVPDTADAEGTTPVVEDVKLKVCGTCLTLVPMVYFDQHQADQHPDVPPGEPANPIAEPPPTAGQH